MTLQPNFLPVGSVVEYNIGTTDKPEWSATVLDCQDLDWLVRSKDDFNLSHRPVPLTPEILTEWCNMKLERKQLSLNIGGELMDYATDGKMCIYYSKKGWTLDSIVNKDTVYFQYLHELQLAYSALTQTVLPITIK